MRQKNIPALVGVLVLVLTPLTAVVADQAFHSQRLSFSLTTFGALTGHPELRSGQVVDIHANGPQVGALERYMINGAKPNTSYQVVLHVFDGGCAGGQIALIPTATLGMDAHENAQGQAVFTPEQLAPFAGMVFGIYWTLVADNIIAYKTPCIVVAID
ncbi:MAG TPA: hypothetical protein VGX03_29755 [Candidatus Binatia bacterium]|jgi:hypothetical protein|nr:hypothetical protein [Candidatus Binatia bacterium]